MTNSIYNLLGFPSADPVMSNYVQPLPDDVKMKMNLMPSLVTTWQQEDIANSDTGGYFSNPNQIGNNTSNTATQIILNAAPFGVSGSSTNITGLISTTWTKANTILHTTVPAFQYHTQRMSNVEGIGSDVDTPHYELSIGYGKLLLVITNKTDGIEDNSTMIGSFGSILAANVISSNANTLLTMARLYANTIVVTTTGTGTELDPYVTTYSSNISLSNAQSLSDSTNAVYNLMNTYKTQDTTFFVNSKSVMDSYSSVSGFNKMGQTETDLIMNHIGTDKIKTRLNS